MNKPTALFPIAALTLAAFTFTACGKKTETKTVVIEKQTPVHVKVPRDPNVVIKIEGKGKNGHIEMHGKK